MRNEADSVIQKSELESKQVETLRRALTEYVMKDWSEIQNYKGGNAQLHSARIISYIYLNRRLSSDAVYKKDRFGATNAIKRAIETLKNNGDILETTGVFYRYNGRCYVIVKECLPEFLVWRSRVTLRPQIDEVKPQIKRNRKRNGPWQIWKGGKNALGKYKVNEFYKQPRKPKKRKATKIHKCTI